MGANVNYDNVYNQNITPLLIARTIGTTEIVKLLTI